MGNIFFLYWYRWCCWKYNHLIFVVTHANVNLCATHEVPMSNSFRAPASILKNARKRPFLYGRGHHFARVSCFVMNDILYARPISPLSNGVYLMPLRPSVAEQSVRDPSGVGPFSITIFMTTQYWTVHVYYAVPLTLAIFPMNKILVAVCWLRSRNFSVLWYWKHEWLATDPPHGRYQIDGHAWPFRLILLTAPHSQQLLVMGANWPWQPARA